MHKATFRGIPRRCSANCWMPAPATRRWRACGIVTGLDSPETIGRFETACPDARFHVAFGQTETSGFVTMAPFRDRPGSAGRPMLMSALDLFDESDNPVPVGQTGEIVVRGPVVFEGYWNLDPTIRRARSATAGIIRATPAPFDADGYLFYKGRSPAKELIKPGGERLSRGGRSRAESARSHRGRRRLRRSGQGVGRGNQRPFARCGPEMKRRLMTSPPSSAAGSPVTSVRSQSWRRRCRASRTAPSTAPRSKQTFA